MAVEREAPLLRDDPGIGACKQHGNGVTILIVRALRDRRGQVLGRMFPTRGKDRFVIGSYTVQARGF
jgi:hypothetical protein